MSKSFHVETFFVYKEKLRNYLIILKSKNNVIYITV